MDFQGEWIFFFTILIELDKTFIQKLIRACLFFQFPSQHPRRS